MSSLAVLVSQLQCRCGSLFYSTAVTFRQQYMRQATTKVIMKNTDCSLKAAYYTLMENDSLLDASDQQINKMGETLNQIGLSNEDIGECPKILTEKANHVIHRHYFLQTMGFSKIKASYLVDFSHIIGIRVAALKAYGAIPPNDCVVTTSLSHVAGLTPEILETLKAKVGKVDEDDTSLATVHRNVLVAFLCWRLDCTPETINTFIDKYGYIKYRSLSAVASTLDLFLNQLGYSKEKILSHGFVLSSDMNDLRELMKKLPYLGSLPIEEAIRQCPRIIHSTSSNLLATLNILRKFGLSDASIAMCPRIFTLSTHTVEARLEQLLKCKEIAHLLSHPRFTYLIFHMNRAMVRLQSLKAANITNFSLHMIAIARESNFQKYINDQDFRSRGTDLINYLSAVLDINPRTALKKHPYWNTIPLANIQESMVLLAKYGFPITLIRQNMQLLLYPADKVKVTLDSIKYLRPKRAFDWSSKLRWDGLGALHIRVDVDSLPCPEDNTPNVLLGFCKDVASVEEPDEVKWEHVLPMCLYLLEKPHHFTGDGVWEFSIDEKTLEEASNEEEAMNEEACDVN